MRFKEDNTVWTQKTLKEICDFYKGIGISKNELSNNGVECILYGQLYTTYKNEIIRDIISKTNLNAKSLFRSKYNDVIIPGSGETPEDIATACCVLKDGVLIGGDINILRPSNLINGCFLSYQLNGKRKYDIAKISQGASIVHLHNDDLKKIKIFIPSNIKIQNKIVVLLEKIDTLIKTQSKIIEDLELLKKSIIHHFFDTSDNNCFLDELIEQTTNRNKDQQINTVLSVNNKYGFIRQSDQFENREVASDNKSSYKVVYKDDFAYNPARINVGSIAKLESFELGIVSPMYICFRCKENKLLPSYLNYYFLSHNFNTALRKKLEGSVRQCLQFNGLCNITIPLPPIDYQLDIVTKANAIVRKIQKEKDILNAYKKQKAYLLQNMFI